MSNYKLEEELKKISADYSYNQSIGNFLLILINSLENNTLCYEIDEEIIKIKDSIKHYILNIKDILSDRESSSLALSKCMELKNQLKNIYLNVFRYFYICKTYSEPLMDEYMLRKYKSEKENFDNFDINTDIVLNDCYNFLNSTEDSFTQKIYISQLFKCVPLKMTRDKLFDLMKKSIIEFLKYNNENSIKRTIDTFSKLFILEKSDNLNKYFPEIWDWLKERKDYKYNEMSDLELEDEYNDFLSTIESLNNIEEYFKNIYYDLNSLIIIFYLSYSFEEITQYNVTYADLYYTVCNILNNELDEIEKESYIETVNTSLSNEFEKMIDKSRDLLDKEAEILDKLGDNLSEETLKFVMSDRFIHDIYYSEINDDIFSLDTDYTLPSADNTFIENIVDKFIDEFKEYLYKIPIKIRKSSIKSFISSIPILLNIDDIMKYLEDGINSEKDVEHKSIILSKIMETFEENGFKNSNHEHNCNCEHEHHHEHNCDCGHHH